MAETITLTIDGKEVVARAGSTVLEAAQQAGLYIPTLCWHPDLTPYGGCRLCIVQIERMRGFPTSCTTPATNGMVVHTNTEELNTLRRNILELLLVEHPSRCLDCDRIARCSPGDICLRDYDVTQRCVVCPKNGHCEMQRVVDYIGIDKITLPVTTRGLPIIDDNPFFERDYNLCILCGRCVRICEEVRGIGAIAFTYRGNRALIGTAFDVPLKDAGCKFCFSCVEVCPTGAIMDKAEKWHVLEGAEREAHIVPCHAACPVGIDVPRYVRLAGEGKYEEALAVLREQLPFPSICALVCFHPCEQACRRGELDEPIAIRTLKRIIVERAEDHQTWGTVAEPSGKRVAVVGSGPAGLAAAYYLRKMGGHETTILEALPEAGGMMRVGIPRYRLPADVLDAEIDVVRRLGVEIKLNTPVESLDALFEQGYDAIVLGLGAHAGTSLRVEGEREVGSPGIIECIDMLREVSLGRDVNLGERVAVIGGGNSAMDAARTALRLGSKETTIVYRRSRAEMPADPMEVEEALHEGVNIILLANPNRIAKENGSLKMECIRMRLGEPDASGRPRPEPILGSEFTLELDNVIAATGQRCVVPEAFGITTGWSNTITVDEATLATSRQGVFAAGDVVTGPATVTEAIAAGRRVASQVDRYLGGSGEMLETLLPPEEINPRLGMDSGFSNPQRPEPPSLPTSERLKGFDEVEGCISGEQARAEAARCMRCDLRLHIGKVPLPLVGEKITL